MFRRMVIIIILIGVAVYIGCSKEKKQPMGPAEEIELDTIPPRVVYFYPSGIVNAPADIDISISFSEDIDAASIDDSEYYILDEGGIKLEGVITTSPQSIKFNPDSDLEIGVTYTAVFNGNVLDSQGNVANINHSWTFKIPAPYDFKVISYYPAANEGCIPYEADIIVDFSGPLDPSTINWVNFTVKSDNGESVPGDFRVDQARIIFQPAFPFKPATKYTVKIYTGIKDIHGFPLTRSKEWSFSTKMANVFPLAIGNKWVYEVAIQTPSYSNYYMDSILIMGDTLMDGHTTYYDQNGHLFRNEHDSIIAVFFKPDYFDSYPPFVLVNNSCSNGLIRTLNTSLGTLDCQYFCKTFIGLDWGYSTDLKYYFAPDIGPVLLQKHVDPGVSEPHGYYTWKILSYKLQK